MQEQEWIEIRGARENNLKNISLRVPKGKITVVTGLSGSGKSSLVFETLYLESQRRFLDGLSTYSKNFIDTFKRPEVDAIKGISPSIAVDQKTASTSPRSTVGTLTEIYDFLRLLYARLGVPKCPVHGISVEAKSSEGIFDWVRENMADKKVKVLAPAVQGEKGEFKKEFEKWAAIGFLKARVDGEWIEINPPPKLHKRKDHHIDLLVDQFPVTEKMLFRLRKSIRRSLEVTENFIVFEFEGKRKLFSLKASCPECGYSFPLLEPKHFSFNHPQGACEACGGLGTQDIEEYIEEERVGQGGMFLSVQKAAYEYLSEGELSRCEECNGSRLNERARSVDFHGKSLPELSELSVKYLRKFFDELSFQATEQAVGEPIVNEIRKRLSYLDSVGTSYLSLDRRSETLSGGERQRLRLASQLGNPLVGVLYILDEPSIGLHAQDHGKLLKVIQELRDQGNTIVIVEHDEETMRVADYMIEIGPGAGIRGGELLHADFLPNFLKNKPPTLTTKYLLGEERITRQPHVTEESVPIEIRDARKNNLKNVDLSFPTECLVGISGVSGSGKSTLIMDVLSEYPEFGSSVGVSEILGLDQFKKVCTVDQKPIGKTPRSVPATYLGVYQVIRNLYASLPESQLRGFKAGHFSFNSSLGRCSECEGLGAVKMGSHFLPEVKVPCGSCRGQRFKPEVLSVRFKEKNISDILEMSFNEAYEFFGNQFSIKRKMKTIIDVGLGYIKLGQDSTTLSGGESQRLKLSKELSKSFRGKVLYILDEPTTGLHFLDVQKLLDLLSGLVEKGHTVLVIEHQLDLLRECDHLIELGPEGGEKGGFVVSQGPPLKVAKENDSPTGKALHELISMNSALVSSENHKVSDDQLSPL